MLMVTERSRAVQLALCLHQYLRNWDRYQGTEMGLCGGGMRFFLANGEKYFKNKDQVRKFIKQIVVSVK